MFYSPHWLSLFRVRKSLMKVWRENWLTHSGRTYNWPGWGRGGNPGLCRTGPQCRQELLTEDTLRHALPAAPRQLLLLLVRVVGEEAQARLVPQQVLAGRSQRDVGAGYGNLARAAASPGNRNISHKRPSQVLSSPWLGGADLAVRWLVERFLSGALLGTVGVGGGGGPCRLGSGLVSWRHGPPVPRTDLGVPLQVVQRLHGGLQVTSHGLARGRGQCWYPAGGTRQRNPDGAKFTWPEKFAKYNQNFLSERLPHLEGGEVGSLETGSLEFEVLEPDLLEWSLL